MSTMELRDLYKSAQLNDREALGTLLQIFHPHLYKNSFYKGRFDFDCYQELSIKFLDCIKRFKDPSEKKVNESLLHLPNQRKIPY